MVRLKYNANGDEALFVVVMVTCPGDASDVQPICARNVPWQTECRAPVSRNANTPNADWVGPRQERGRCMGGTDAEGKA